MKKSLLTLLLSSSFVLLFAQKHTEISLDLPALSRNNTVELTVERQLNDRFSILFGAAYRYNSRLNYKTGEQEYLINSIDSSTITINSYDYYRAQYLNVFAEGRYYFKPRKGMDRFYTGLGLFAETLLSIEEGYPNDLKINRGGLNIPLGYKVVVKDKISIDLGINLLFGIQSFNNLTTVSKSSSIILNMLFNGRVGYRF